MTTAAGIGIMLALVGAGAGACFALSRRFWETAGVIMLLVSGLLGARVGWRLGSAWSPLAGLIDAWLGLFAGFALVLWIAWLAYLAEAEYVQHTRWERWR
jgi:hypothetical protein